MLIIIISPFAFYLHLLSPNEEQVWETMFFTMDAGYFENIRNYLWIYSYKILTILLISLWFITCKNWWRFFLFVPLSWEIFKFTGFIDERYNFFNPHNYITSFPIFVLYAMLLIFISKKLNYYSKNKRFKTQLNSEIYLLMKELSVFRNSDSKELKEQLKRLRQQKDVLDKKVYLTKLLELRDSLSI